jgi:hypothetical protein
MNLRERLTRTMSGEEILITEPERTIEASLINISDWRQMFRVKNISGFSQPALETLDERQQARRRIEAAILRWATNYEARVIKELGEN